MTTPADRAASAFPIAYRDVVSDDGTRVRAWTNDPGGVVDGPTVVLCNGLGTNPYAWPALLRPGCGVRVVSWNHRGTGGSERPSDPQRVGVDVFVEDGLSVMDAFGVDRAVLMGWSFGVNVMFQLAAEHPERARGLFAVAGVPGGTFSTMLGPLRLPRVAAHTLAVNLSRTVKLTGRAITPLTSRIPVGPLVVDVLGHSGFMFPIPDRELAALAIAEFLQTPTDWYAHLALRSSEHGRVPLDGIGVPVEFVAGTYDIMAGARHMAAAAARIDGSTYVELRGSHFLQMEQPEQVHALLIDFLARVG